MRGAVAAQLLEMYGTLHSPKLLPVDRVTGLVRACPDPVPLPTEAEHLRHERQAVQLAVGIERSENFLFAPNLDHISSSQSVHVSSMSGLIP